MKLNKNEYVVTAYASRASGPGWANTPIWVVIKDGETGKMREECIQPDDHTEGMRTLYHISDNVHTAMCREVSLMLENKKKKK